MKPDRWEDIERVWHAVLARPEHERSVAIIEMCGEDNALRGIIIAANRMFVAVGVCMVRDIGPIAEHLLEKALRDARTQHPALFQRVAGARDGSLPEETMIRNLGMLKESNPRGVLLGGLDAYLSSILTVVRRFLGPEHEANLVRLVREELR